MSELKACPFCGTSVVGIEYDGLYRWVECGNMDCNAAGKVFAFLTDVGNADHIVANNWNTRPIEDGLRAELASRDEIITRLKEDAERLAVEQNYFCCQKHEAYMCHFEETDAHNPDCPIVLHLSLIHI